MSKIINLEFLDEANKEEIIRRCRQGIIVSPLCPDYHFREVNGPSNRKERIHDFDNLGEEVGIVYLKLIKETEKLFSLFEKERIDYKHLLLIADVESEDLLILSKLKINRKTFISRCRISVKKINQDLKKRGLRNSRCLLMSQLFTREEYDFFGTIKNIKSRLLKERDRRLTGLIKEVCHLRLPLHQFWFGIDEKTSYARSIDEMAMYASFGYCPRIDRGIILCADSAILSRCYNLFKAKKTPVIYIKGSY